MSDFFKNLEKKLASFFQTRGLSFLRFTLALIYFWYGLLKVLDLSPIEPLVEKSTSWLAIPHFSIWLGCWEMLIGICLWIPRLYFIGLLLLFLQIPGTFLPLFLVPEECFLYFPYALTLKGKYIFKNFIIISAGCALLGAPQSTKTSL